MNFSELKDLLLTYRKRASSAAELKKLWAELSDERNEEAIKACLLSDLNTFKADNEKDDDVNFNQMFKNIQSQISINPQNNTLQERKNRKPVRLMLSFYKVAAVLIIAFIAGGTVSYYFIKEPQQAVVAYTTIKAPLGAKSEVVLPDGSQVWINAGSTIKYDNSFNKITRTILLEGEAYFKVAKNKDVPFIVNTSDIDIVALGTEFNVKAYAEEDFVETTLVEGKVAIKGDENGRNKNIKEVTLEPKQKAVYLRSNKNVKIVDEKTEEIISVDKALPLGTVYIAQKIDPLPIIAWKDNKLIIRSEELSSLAIKLERKYNVNISFDSKPIMKYRFSGTLEDETLTQVLDVIKLTSPIDYKLDGKEVTIYENASMLKKFNNYLNKK